MLIVTPEDLQEYDDALRGIRTILDNRTLTTEKKCLYIAALVSESEEEDTVTSNLNTHDRDICQQLRQGNIDILSTIAG